jgi:hypothetical protein
MTTLSANILRLVCNADRPDQLRDQRTGLAPVLLRAATTKIQLGVFFDGALIDDISNWSSITMEVRASADPTAALLITKTVASGFAIPTLSAWQAKTAQHATLSLSQAETTVATGTLRIAIWATLNDASRLWLGYGDFKLIETGASAPGTPPINDPNYYTKGESDARFALVAADTATTKRGEATIGNAVDTITIPFATAFAAVPSFILATCNKPGATGYNLFATERRDLRTAAGFTMELQGPTPDALHKITWLALL